MDYRSKIVIAAIDMVIFISVIILPTQIAEIFILAMCILSILAIIPAVKSIHRLSIVSLYVCLGSVAILAVTIGSLAIRLIVGGEKPCIFLMGFDPHGYKAVAILISVSAIAVVVTILYIIKRVVWVRLQILIRFASDVLPGKMMTIESGMRNGEVSQDHALKCRDMAVRETRFVELIGWVGNCQMFQVFTNALMLLAVLVYSIGKYLANGSANILGLITLSLASVMSYLFILAVMLAIVRVATRIVVR